MGVIPLPEKEISGALRNQLFLGKQYSCPQKSNTLDYFDKGLTWKAQLDKVINRDYRAFWTHNGTSGKTWGLKLQVVRPIIIYATTICWS
jgi:hypothetical protein